MKTAELEGKILDYYVALAVGHVWRRKWNPENENYASWQSYENGWGNPTPPYSSDWAAGGPVIEKEQITIRPDFQGGAVGLFHNEQFSGWEELDGPTMLVAAMRAIVVKHFGYDVPDVKL